MTDRELQAYTNFSYALIYHNLACFVRNSPWKIKQDRMIIECKPLRIDALANELQYGGRGFKIEPNYKIHGPTAFASWREDVPFASLQITVHLRDNKTYLELDYDYGNPRWGDLASLGLHGIEFLTNVILRVGRTDPFRIRKMLNARGRDIPLIKSKETA